jgi:hypothetical protein
MKRSMLVSMIILVVLGAGVAIAEGQYESPQAPTDAYGPGRRMQPGWGMNPGWNPEDYQEPERITVTGAVNLENSWFPTIMSEGTEYDVMVPRYHLASINLENDQSVTVEGYLFDDTRRPGTAVGGDELPVIHVTKAIISGTEYDLSEQFSGPGGRSARGGARRR